MARNEKRFWKIDIIFDENINGEGIFECNFDRKLNMLQIIKRYSLRASIEKKMNSKFIYLRIDEYKMWTKIDINISDW